MSHHTYVSDIYNWVINDVITKVHKNVINSTPCDSVLQEIAESWERRVSASKICEASDDSRHIHYSSGKNLSYDLRKNCFSSYDDHELLRLKHNSYMNSDTVRVQISQRFKQLQEAISLLSHLYDKTPIEYSLDRSYYYFSYYHYYVAATNLLNQIQTTDSKHKIRADITPNITSPMIKMPFQESEKSTLVSKTIHDNISASKSCNLEAKKKYRYNKPSNKYSNKSKMVTPSSPVGTIPNPDREELSDLTESGDEHTQSLNDECESNINSIVSCYEKVKLRKTTKRTGWQGLLTCGIMFIDNKEYIFREATMDLTWDEEGAHNKKIDITKIS